MLHLNLLWWRHRSQWLSQGRSKFSSLFFQNISSGSTLLCGRSYDSLHFCLWNFLSWLSCAYWSINHQIFHVNRLRMRGCIHMIHHSDSGMRCFSLQCDLLWRCYWDCTSSKIRQYGGSSDIHLFEESCINFFSSERRIILIRRITFRFSWLRRPFSRGALFFRAADFGSCLFFMRRSAFPSAFFFSTCDLMGRWFSSSLA